MPKTKPTASVVVPALNTERFLQPCLESLVAQTEKDFEIIIVDDCSTDDLKAVADRFASSGPDIKYVRHTRNHGALCARLTGVDHSSGDYIGFLDSDDVAQPNYVERLLATAAETGADIVGSTKESNAQESFAIEGTAALLKAYASRRIPNWSVWTKLYKKDLVAGLSELRTLAATETFIRANDLVLNIFCALKGPRYVNIPETLVYYTKGRVGSITNPETPDRWREGFTSLIRTYELLREAASEYEADIDQIIAQSAKNNYRYRLAARSREDLDWVRSCAAQSPLGHVVISAMLEAADENQRRLADRLAKNEHRTARLKEKLALKSESLAAVRKSMADLRTREAERRSRPLRAFLIDVLRWGRSRLRR